MADILAVAFDCYGTLVDFGYDSFARAYGTICEEQGMAYDGQVFFDKWMEVWRRLAAEGKTMDGNADGGIAVREHSAAANSGTSRISGSTSCESAFGSRIPHCPRSSGAPRRPGWIRPGSAGTACAAAS